MTLTRDGLGYPVPDTTFELRTGLKFWRRGPPPFGQVTPIYWDELAGD